MHKHSSAKRYLFTGLWHRTPHSPPLPQSMSNSALLLPKTPTKMDLKPANPGALQ